MDRAPQPASKTGCELRHDVNEQIGEIHKSVSGFSLVLERIETNLEHLVKADEKHDERMTRIETKIQEDAVEAAEIRGKNSSVIKSITYVCGAAVVAFFGWVASYFSKGGSA